MLVAGTYCVVGGMYSVILNDVIQLVLKVFASVIIAVIAIRVTTAEHLAQAVPAGWDNLFFGWNLGLDWSTRIPPCRNGFTVRAGTVMRCSGCSFPPCS